jgi:protein-S-isoprenylcysteine O-methyltransferase Ste14
MANCMRSARLRAPTGYIGVGIAFEEHDTKRDPGQAYRAHRARVPALIPALRPRGSTENP